MGAGHTSLCLATAKSPGGREKQPPGGGCFSEWASCLFCPHSAHSNHTDESSGSGAQVALTYDRSAATVGPPTHVLPHHSYAKHDDDKRRVSALIMRVQTVLGEWQGAQAKGEAVLDV